MNRKQKIRPLIEKLATPSSTYIQLGSSSTAPQGKWKPSGKRYGTCQPPKNKVVERLATTIVSRKSVRKNIPNFIPLYSTKYPIMSDSPSGKSKGTRFVAASAAVTKTKKATGWVTMPQRGSQPPTIRP